MKLILTTEVDHLGSAGDTVEVRDGYGRNYLLPRGLAIVASRLPGIEELVSDEQQALLVDNEPQQVADALQRVDLGVR